MLVFGLPHKLGARRCWGASVSKVLIHSDLTFVSLEQSLLVLRLEKSVCYQVVVSSVEKKEVLGREGLLFYIGWSGDPVTFEQKQMCGIYTRISRGRVFYVLGSWSGQGKS